MKDMNTYRSSSVRREAEETRIATGRLSASDAIALVSTRIVRDFHPQQIILFGSHGRGDADERSDIDLLIVMPDGPNRQATALAITQSLSDLTVPTDVLVTTQEEIARRAHVVGTVLRSALQEGKVLYDRS